MIIRLDATTKTKLRKLAQAEGKNTSQLVRELIDNYIQDRDMGAYVDDLWQRLGKQMKARETGTNDIERAIHDGRASRK